METLTYSYNSSWQNLRLSRKEWLGYAKILQNSELNYKQSWKKQRYARLSQLNLSCCMNKRWDSSPPRGYSSTHQNTRTQRLKPTWTTWKWLKRKLKLWLQSKSYRWSSLYSPNNTHKTSSFFTKKDVKSRYNSKGLTSLELNSATSSRIWIKE